MVFGQDGESKVNELTRYGQSSIHCTEIWITISWLVRPSQNHPIFNMGPTERQRSVGKCGFFQLFDIIWHSTICRSLSLGFDMGLPLHFYVNYVDTTSTAQGGGGSFKNRKPIGEVGCCESGMAERSHWWIERGLISLTLSLSFPDYLPTYLSIFYVSIYLCIYLSIDLSISLSLSSNYLSIYLFIYLLIYLSIYLSLFLSSVHLSVSLSVCLSIYLWLSMYLSICLSIYVSIYLSISLCIYLSLYVSIYLSMYLSIYLSVCLSVCLSICLAIYLSISSTQLASLSLSFI